jgi:rhodanese-related sulfurtransferase
MRTSSKLGLFVVLATLSACTRSATPVASVSPKETEGLLRNNFALLVDVRESDEVTEGIAAPARWAPLSKMENEADWKAFASSLPKDKQIVFYCASGGRAQRVAEKLAQLGFKTGNMGGYDDWKSAGLPVRKP